jgi:Ca-activated chloride channel homolog
MRLRETGKRRACAAALSLVLAAAPALFVSDSEAQTTTRRTTATRKGNPATRRAAAATTNPVRSLQQPMPSPKPTPSPTPVRVPQLDPAGPPPHMPTPLPQPTRQPQPPADKPPADAIDDDEIITVTSNLVVVPVSVTDATGQPVQGLKSTDFRLEEEGRAQEIAQLGDAEQVPLDIALLFDTSSSIAVNRFFDFQKQSAEGFLRQVLKPSDRAAVFTIATEPRLVHELSPAAPAITKVSSLQPPSKSTATAFYDTIMRAAKYLTEKSSGGRRRVMLVISDGEDNNSELLRGLPIADLRAEAEAVSEGRVPPREANRRVIERHARAVRDVQQVVQRGDIVFYSINPSGPGVRLNHISQRAQDAMQAVADSTGGVAHLPASERDLEPIFRSIAAELRAQYLIQYYSNSDAPAGKFLRIRVATPTRPEARVRARQGYYSKKG